MVRLSIAAGLIIVASSSALGLVVDKNILIERETDVADHSLTDENAMFRMSTQNAKKNAGYKWRESPLVVGGTSGSGTRGVEDVLVKLGIYMHPEDKTGDLFRDCYNKYPLDNHCMKPTGGGGVDISFRKGRTDLNVSTVLSGEHYLDWLYDKECPVIGFNPPQDLSKSGIKFMKSVPAKNRKPLRWGWKIPATMFQLNRLLSKYPGMAFVHVLRNPLDMAASYLEHLPVVSSMFSNIHGGPDKAAELIVSRCTQVNAAYRTVHQCAVSRDEFAEMSDFSRCFKHKSECHPEATPSSAWSCLHAMLWAEVNHAVHAFGERCLRPARRYLYYHGEDGYALRGASNQTGLAKHLAQTLDLPLRRVVKAFDVPRRRRLSYGKFRDLSYGLDAALTAHCAEAALPGALAHFGYGEDLDL